MTRDRVNLVMGAALVVAAILIELDVIALFVNAAVTRG